MFTKLPDAPVVTNDSSPMPVIEEAAAAAAAAADRKCALHLCRRECAQAHVVRIVEEVRGGVQPSSARARVLQKRRHRHFRWLGPHEVRCEQHDSVHKAFSQITARHSVTCWQLLRV